jgi:type IV pilus assembly protein PilM
MTRLFFKDKPIIGLDISSTGIKIMAIDLKKWLVIGYGALDLDPAKIKDSIEGNGSFLGESIKSLMKESIIGELPSNYVAISIPTARSYSRTFNLPASVEKSLKDAVELEVDQYIPIPASTLYIDYEIIERNSKEITILMSAIPKLIVDNCTKAAKDAGLEVVFIEPSISSVARLLAKTEEGNLPTIIVDVGPANTDIAVVDDTKIRVTGGAAVGGNTITLDIAKKFDISVDDAHQLKIFNGLSAGPRQEKIKKATEETLKKIVNETRKVIRYYNERISDDRKLEQLLVVGSGSNMPGIGEYFTDELVMPSRVASPWQKLNFGQLPEPDKQFRSRYITVAGLAVLPRSALND